MENLYYRKYRLSADLAPLAKYAWVMKCSEAESKPDLLIPDGYPEVIFVQKGAYRKEYLGPEPDTTIIDRSCVVGIQTRSVLARRLNHCHLVGLKLNPVGAYALWGDRLKQTLDVNQPLTEFGVAWLQALDQKLRPLQDDHAILEVLTGELSRQMKQAKGSPNAEQAGSFLTAILSRQGQASVQELADQHCLSVRHFQRKFKAFFGVSPKKFLNLIRFKHLYKASVLQLKPPADFLAYGYYDQMHFIKDFRRHLGVSPSKSIESWFHQLNQMARLNA